MKPPLGTITRSGVLDPFRQVPELGGTQKTYSSLFLDRIMHLFMACNGHIIPALVIYHIHALHLRKSLHYHTSAFSMLFLFYQLHTFYFHRSHIMFTHAQFLMPCIFICKTKNKKKDQKKVTIKHESLHHILSYMCWVP